MELLLKKEEKKEEIQTTEVTDICSDIYFSTLIKKKNNTNIHPPTSLHRRSSHKYILFHSSYLHSFSLKTEL